MDTNEVEDVTGADNIPALAPDDVYQVALLLTRLNLPKDLIPLILDYGGLHVSRLGAHNTQPKAVRQYQTGLVHSTASIPHDIHPGSVRAVVFETISHDQGWSDHDQQGTYEGSWTWFEAGTIKSMSRTENRSASETDEDASLDNQQQQQCQDKDFRRIVTNVHASSRFRKHRVKWSRNDEDPWIRNVFTRLQNRQSIGIRIHAMYPGWTNHVASTSISFEYLPVRKVP